MLMRWSASPSGGTDVCTSFVTSRPLLPIHLGEIQCRSLGAKVESFDEHGRPVVGEVGELVVTEPLPSMPLFLWNDPDGERYWDSYFSTCRGVAPRRLARDHRAWHPHHQRAFDSTLNRAASAWARPSSTGS